MRVGWGEGGVRVGWGEGGVRVGWVRVPLAAGMSGFIDGFGSHSFLFLGCF